MIFNNNSNDLCSLALSISNQIWDLCSKAVYYDMVPNETTITDSLLLTYAFSPFKNIILDKFNNKEEPYTGADWELWLNSEKKWFGLRIQAKKFSRKKKYIMKRDQLRILLKTAEKDNYYPLYTFYNYSDEFKEIFDNAKKSKIKEYGCSYVSGKLLTVLNKNQKYISNNFLDRMKPWYTIFCPSNNNSNLIESATESLKKHEEELAEDIEKTDFDKLVTDNPPHYIKSMISNDVPENAQIKGCKVKYVLILSDNRNSEF